MCVCARKTTTTVTGSDATKTRRLLSCCSWLCGSLSLSLSLSLPAYFTVALGAAVTEFSASLCLCVTSKGTFNQVEFQSVEIRPSASSSSSSSPRSDHHDQQPKTRTMPSKPAYYTGEKRSCQWMKCRGNTVCQNQHQQETYRPSHTGLFLLVTTMTVRHHHRRG